jgi:glutamate synthase domain-containing protein 1
LPELGQYAVGVFFYEKKTSDESMLQFEKIADDYNLKIIYWRTVPVDINAIGEVSKLTEPLTKQVNIILKLFII